MSTSPISIESNDREEGEIVDDEDVFEDISDNSISNLESLPSGKLNTHEERLRALSLSSVSDVEVPEEVVVKHHHTRKCPRRRKRSKSEKRNSYLKHRRYSDDHSSDSDEKSRPNKRLKRQLKEAVRITTPDTNAAHHNSLRTRLRGMVRLGDDSDSSVVAISDKADEEATVSSGPVSAAESNVQTETKDTVEVRNKDSDDDLDSDLTALRLEALKTAIINKHKHRKKRKQQTEVEDMVLSDSSQKSELFENKENDTAVNNSDNIILSNKKLCLSTGKAVEKVEVPASPVEEDADVLRALLLASMANKITSKPKEEKDVPEIQNKVIEIKSSVDVTVKTDVEQKLQPKVQIEVKNVIGNGNNVKGAVAPKTATLKSNPLQVVKQINTLNKVVNNIKGNNIYRKTASRSLSKHTFQQSKPVILPPVKPLIININADSDSEEDIFGNSQEDVKKDDIPVDSKVESIVENQVIESTNVVQQTSIQQKIVSKDKIIEKTAEKLDNSDEKGLKETELNKDDLKVPPEIQESLEHFLKQERAKVEANLAKKATPPPAESKDPVLKQERTKDETDSAVCKTPVPVENKTITTQVLEKSVVKLLPKNKQIEYRNLIQQIKSRESGEKKVRPRRLSQKNVEDKPVVASKKFVSKNKTINKVNTTTKLVTSRVNALNKVNTVNKITAATQINAQNKTSTASKISTLSKVNATSKMNTAGKPTAASKVSAMKSLKLERAEGKSSKKIEIEGFTQALRDMQFLSNGSLQIKGKYQPLNSLMDEITKANREKKKYELSIKRLIQELADARTQFTRWLDKYKSLAEELVFQKNLIDGSKKQEKSTIVNYASSTPMKPLRTDTGLKTIPTTLSPVGKTVQVTDVKQSKELIKKTDEKVVTGSDHKDINESPKSDALVEKATTEKIEIPESTVEKNNVETQKLDVVVSIVKTDLETKISDDTVKTVSDLQDKSDLKSIVEEEPKTDEKERVELKEIPKGISTYVSPLGNYSRLDEVDPLAIFCPYEMSGSCRDPDCSYAHFSKPGE